MQAAQVELELKPDFASLDGVGNVAVAVSGGSDSMAMLLLLIAWARTLQTSPSITALTVDHGLRVESTAEATTVAGWCATLGVAHATVPWLGDKPATGIQATARAARYELMTAWCTRSGVPVLLTGHTADDQNETVLMRQRRTMSVRSMAGIWPERGWNGIRILRPLLKLRRQDLCNYLKAEGQSWLEDSSNENLKFERVRIRQDLAVRMDNPGLLAVPAQVEVRQANSAAKDFLAAHTSVSSLGLITCDIAAFKALNPLAADAVLLSMLELTGKRAAPEREHRQNMIEWLGSDSLGRRTLGGAFFVKRKAGLFLAREAGRIDPSPVSIPPEGRMIWDGRFVVEGPSGAQVEPLGAFGDLPKKDMPQFLRLGLPAAMIDGKLAFVPQLQPNPLFNCELIKDDARG